MSGRLTSQEPSGARGRAARPTTTSGVSRKRSYHVGEPIESRSTHVLKLVALVLTRKADGGVDTATACKHSVCILLPRKPRLHVRTSTLWDECPSTPTLPSALALRYAPTEVICIYIYICYIYIYIYTYIYYYHYHHHYYYHIDVNKPRHKQTTPCHLLRTSGFSPTAACPALPPRRAEAVLARASGEYIYIYIYIYTCIEREREGERERDQ